MISVKIGFLFILSSLFLRNTVFGLTNDWYFGQTIYEFGVPVNNQLVQIPNIRNKVLLIFNFATKIVQDSYYHAIMSLARLVKHNEYFKIIGFHCNSYLSPQDGQTYKDLELISTNRIYVSIDELESENVQVYESKFVNGNSLAIYKFLKLRTGPPIPNQNIDIEAHIRTLKINDQYTLFLVDNYGRPVGRINKHEWDENTLRDHIVYQLKMAAHEDYTNWTDEQVLSGSRAAWYIDNIDKVD